jgi:hypothetical protein
MRPFIAHALAGFGPGPEYRAEYIDVCVVQLGTDESIVVWRDGSFHTVETPTLVLAKASSDWPLDFFDWEKSE